MGIAGGGNFEISDNRGATTAYEGTATTSVANVPSSAGNAISQCLIKSEGNNLQISFDDGTSFITLDKSEALTWDVKGEITQLQIKTSSGSVNYRILINTEDV